MISFTLWHSHGFNFSSLVETLVRGFAWSVGWMAARDLGLPAAGVVLIVLGVSLFVIGWRHRRVSQLNKMRDEDVTGVSRDA